MTEAASSRYEKVLKIAHRSGQLMFHKKHHTMPNRRNLELRERWSVVDGAVNLEEGIERACGKSTEANEVAAQ